VQEFAAGPDGGRDAKFVGTAQRFPSTASPLTGKIIVQAKHTSNPIGKFSDSDFSGDSASSCLNEEYPRVRNRVTAGELDHYLLFSNRRLAAQTNELVCQTIKDACGVESVHLFGVEALDRILKRLPWAAQELERFQHDLPLRASPDELAEVILAITRQDALLDWTKTKSATVEERVRFKKKNIVNGLTEDYAAVITRNYLRDFDIVKCFLEHPANYDANARYRDAAGDFAAKLISYRDDFRSYDRLLNFLLTKLIERDGDLRANKRLTRTVFYYMYWSCDIGNPPEPPTDATS